jgi:uncharacterized protein
MAFWDRITSRGNVEDRRSMAPVAGGIGLGGLALFMLLNVLTGGDIGDVLSVLPQLQVDNPGSVNSAQYEGADSYEVFASTVLGSANDMWTAAMVRRGRTYTPPRLVLFRSATTSACGTATSQVGPHYCPLDSTIYLDETFFDELTARFGARGGDVAEAYVIAHEVGHHVQNELGLMGNADPYGDTGQAIVMELQADCFAGLWANSLRGSDVFESGEIREAMDAAAAVGDDRIQERVTGQVNPETWTHGSSEQRVEWFTRGYETGEVEQCRPEV